jgi:hypothetical protein
MSVIEQTELEAVAVSTVELDNPITGLFDIIIDTADEDRIGGPASGRRFETLVFPLEAWHGDEMLIEIDGQRYDTLEEAKAGHLALVEKWRGRAAHDS